MRLEREASCPVSLSVARRGAMTGTTSAGESRTRRPDCHRPGVADADRKPMHRADPLQLPFGIDVVHFDLQAVRTGPATASAKAAAVQLNMPHSSVTTTGTSCQ